jgi:hypothetical protein
MSHNFTHQYDTYTRLTSIAWTNAPGTLSGTQAQVWQMSGLRGYSRTVRPPPRRFP